MIDKLKELLGEELSKQVEDKLGKVELAIFNDGTVVPSDKYDTLKTDNKALETKYQTDVAEFTMYAQDVKKQELVEHVEGLIDFIDRGN